MIKDVCSKHGQIAACIVKQAKCGHEEYDMELPLIFCPYCAEKLQDINGEKVE